MLWRHCGNLRRSTRRARYCSSYYTTNSPYLLHTFPSVEPSNGMGTTLGSGSGLDRDKTLACRTLGTPPCHAWRTVPPQQRPRRPLESPGRRCDLRSCPRLRDTWWLRTPPEELAEPRARGGPDRHVEVPDPSAGVRMARGGPRPTCGGRWPQVLSISTSGTRDDTGPVPRAGSGSGTVGPVR